MCDETAKGECYPKQLYMRSKKAKAAIRDWCCGKVDLKEENMGGEWDAPQSNCVRSDRAMAAMRDPMRGDCENAKTDNR